METESACGARGGGLCHSENTQGKRPSHSSLFMTTHFSAARPHLLRDLQKKPRPAHRTQPRLPRMVGAITLRGKRASAPFTYPPRRRDSPRKFFYHPRRTPDVDRRHPSQAQSHLDMPAKRFPPWRARAAFGCMPRRSHSRYARAQPPLLRYGRLLRMRC